MDIYGTAHSSFMQTWQEIVRAYDYEKKKELLRTRKVTCSQFAVVSLLMYLVMGEDWPYNMAKNFEILSEGPLNRHTGLGILKHPSNLGYLLEEMEKDGLVIGRRDEMEVRRHHYYRLDPNIFRSPISGSENRKSNGSIFEIPLEMINKFLKLQSYNNYYRKMYIKSWEYIAEFEFLTFMIFVKDIIEEHSPMLDLIEKYIQRLEGPIKVNTPPSAGYSYLFEMSQARKKRRTPYSRAKSNYPWGLSLALDKAQKEIEGE